MAVDLIKTLNPLIVDSVIYTDITKDGGLKGVSLNQTVNFAWQSFVEWGGYSSKTKS